MDPPVDGLRLGREVGEEDGGLGHVVTSVRTVRGEAPPRSRGPKDHCATARLRARSSHARLSASPGEPSSTSSRAPSPATATGEPCGLRGDDGTTTWLELPRARPAEPARRVATALPRPQARRPSPDVVALGPGARRRRTSGRSAPASSSCRSTCAWRADAIRRIADRSESRQLVIGTGRDAPRPGGGRPRPPADHDHRGPLRGAGRRRSRPTGRNRSHSWERPGLDDVYLLIYTSGTTGTPKGVMLTHRNTVAGIDSFHLIVPDIEYRIVSLLPLSHLFEQAIGLYLLVDLGAEIMYVRSLNPRVIFEAIREHRMTGMIVVPQVLDLFWSGIEREVEKQGRSAEFARRAADRAPPADGPAPAPLQAGPRAARWQPPPLRLGRRVPPALGPAGVGGPRRRRHAGLRCHRDRLGGDQRRGRSTRPGASAGRSPASRCGSPRTARSSSAAPP